MEMLDAPADQLDEQALARAVLASPFDLPAWLPSSTGAHGRTCRTATGRTSPAPLPL